ncbi:EF-hand domain-containing protein [Steroidobacter sp. S1-65]|uniref:EF-hand domain-containing protein n=1 Tax=Steroidobacter gossypii TaxID=2805490 RepID=A0ABS1X4W8_9GAMM|nr:EF-hand domain-containing protein [Steroidobacter gossypii]MBM0108265.1 EF-hand domain-containing protein [Steroidobacter gossypii]
MSRKFFPTVCLILLGAPAMAQVRGEGIFERADTNNDGSITREEFVAARQDQFAKFDRNSDGHIDSSDIPKRLAARRQRSGGADFVVGQFDADGDGRVTKEEFVNGPTLIFDRADTDKNNVLDPKELAAAKQAAQSRRR